MRKTFDKLAIGEKFNFDPRFEHKHRTDCGPWLKVSKRKYCHVDVIGSGIDEKNYPKIGYIAQKNAPVICK